MRELRRSARKLFAKGGGSSRPHASSRHLKRKKMKVRRSDPTLSFTIGSSWAWSLRIYEERSLIGIMQAASPFACLAKVGPFFATGGEPRPPFKVLIRCNANHRLLKLDRRSMAHFADDGDGPPSDEGLRRLSDYFQRDLTKVADSTSVTVMTDGEGEIIDSVALLRRVIVGEAAGH